MIVGLKWSPLPHGPSYTFRDIYATFLLMEPDLYSSQGQGLPGFPFVLQHVSFMHLDDGTFHRAEPNSRFS